MDNNMIELAAEIVFKICENHPEICPHIYNWVGDKSAYMDGKNVTLAQYRCGLCKHEKTEIKND